MFLDKRCSTAVPGNMARAVLAWSTPPSHAAVGENTYQHPPTPPTHRPINQTKDKDTRTQTNLLQSTKYVAWDKRAHQTQEHSNIARSTAVLLYCELLLLPYFVTGTGVRSLVQQVPHINTEQIQKYTHTFVNRWSASVRLYTSPQNKKKLTVP